MTADSIDGWDGALREATHAIRVALPTDLTALRDGVALSLHAIHAAEATTTEDGLRWAALSESVLAVTHDLGRVPASATQQEQMENRRPSAPEIRRASLAPDDPPPGTAASIAALRQLWTSILEGLDAYATTGASHNAVLVAAFTARGIHRLLTINAQTPGAAL